eukprot:6175474-Pleurochrysis_carterae.AAC.1
MARACARMCKREYASVCEAGVKLRVFTHTYARARARLRVRVPARANVCEWMSLPARMCVYALACTR